MPIILEKSLLKESSNSCPAIGYNITHDNDTVAMVSRLGDKTSANKIGIDIMKCALPKGETISSFLHAIGDTVSICIGQELFPR